LFLFFREKEPKESSENMLRIFGQALRKYKRLFLQLTNNQKFFGLVYIFSFSSRNFSHGLGSHASKFRRPKKRFALGRKAFLAMTAPLNRGRLLARGIERKARSIFFVVAQVLRQAQHDNKKNARTWSDSPTP
jgi:hypothetical protein